MVILSKIESIILTCCLAKVSLLLLIKAWWCVFPRLKHNNWDEVQKSWSLVTKWTINLLLFNEIKTCFEVNQGLEGEMSFWIRNSHTEKHK